MVLGIYTLVGKGRIVLSEPISVWDKVLNDSLKILKTTFVLHVNIKDKYYLCFVHSRLTMRKLDYKRITN